MSHLIIDGRISYVYSKFCQIKLSLKRKHCILNIFLLETKYNDLVYNTIFCTLYFR